MIDTSKIRKYVEIGAKDKDWYSICTQTFIEIFGREDLSLVCKLFASTSINTSLQSNITLFRRAYYEIKHSLPVGHTGRYLPNIEKQLHQVRAGLPLTGRKIEAFSIAMDDLPQSHEQVVVDVHLSRAFGVDKQYFRQGKGKPEGIGLIRDGGVSDKHYTIIEEWCRDEAMVSISL